MTAMDAKQAVIADLMGLAPVIPVLVIEDADKAAPLARALVAGGLPAIEITLRTPAALDAVKRVAAEVEGAMVGVGTVIEGAQLDAAEKAGARFAVSPGMAPKLLAAAADHALPLLPGAASASEAMALYEAGYQRQKFFPAENAGGAGFLKSLASPLPQISFCPTGGIDAALARAYLALPNVACVGGSWVAPKKLVAEGDWAAIEALAAEAAALRPVA